MEGMEDIDFIDCSDFSDSIKTKIKFYHIEKFLKLGREIEFGYNKKKYSIINGTEHCWWIVCDKDNLNEKLCEFQDKDTLVSKIRDFKIDGVTISEIFDELKHDINVLWIA